MDYKIAQLLNDLITGIKHEVLSGPMSITSLVIIDNELTKMKEVAVLAFRDGFTKGTIRACNELGKHIDKQKEVTNFLDNQMH
jgi:hypothetical protein